jgi:hypothetical protein
MPAKILQNGIEIGTVDSFDPTPACQGPETSLNNFERDLVQKLGDELGISQEVLFSNENFGTTHLRERKLVYRIADAFIENFLRAYSYPFKPVKTIVKGGKRNSLGKYRRLREEERRKNKTSLSSTCTGRVILSKSNCEEIDRPYLRTNEN